METWSQQAYLKASNAGAIDGLNLGDEFGGAVAVAGDTVVIGAKHEASPATGVNGDQSDDGATYAGAAYVFVRTGTTWSQQAYVKASNSSGFNLFGNSVAILGDRMVIGATGERCFLGGNGCVQGDSGLNAAGAAYVFVRHGTTWSQETYLKASNPDSGDSFGSSVAIEDGAAVHRSPFHAPAGMRLCTHLCRGNFKSTWAAQGGYEPVAEALLSEMNVDGYFLEYDDERSGDFKPLRFLPKGKTVVLGLVTTKAGTMESKDTLKRRIDEASRYAPLDQLALSPQCGFSSTVHGNAIAMEAQAAKLRLVVEVASEVWGGV